MILKLTALLLYSCNYKSVIVARAKLENMK